MYSPKQAGHRRSQGRGKAMRKKGRVPVPVVSLERGGDGAFELVGCAADGLVGGAG